DGNIWFTEHHINQIGRITPAGVVKEFPLAPGALPSSLTSGPDGNLWFTDGVGKIGRISTTGNAVYIPLPGGVTAPTEISVGPDANIWFTDSGSDEVTRVTLPAFAQIAVYRKSTGQWFIHRAQDGGLTQVNWGVSSLGDLPVPGDYDGDGKTDIAVYRGSTGLWFIHRSSDGGLTQIAWGAPTLGDVPAPGDYDADGITDIAVYRSSTGEWFIRRSSDGGLTYEAWGAPTLGDVPVPARY